MINERKRRPGEGQKPHPNRRRSERCGESQDAGDRPVSVPDLPRCPGLGTADFGLHTDRVRAFAILDTFREAGGNFLDTANVYCRWVPGKDNCSEQVIGAWLKDRHDREMVIATKGGHYSFSDRVTSRVTEAEVRRDLEDSLRTLGLDRIDVYWLHRDNEELATEEIAAFMNRFVQEGKIRFWGISNLTADRVRAFGRHLHGVSNQWSLALESREMAETKDPTTLRCDREMLRTLQALGIPLFPYTSSAHGCFARMEQGLEVHGLWDTPANRSIFSVLKTWAERLHVSCHVLSQAWLLNQPFQVFPVMAVSSPGQLAGLEAICSLKLPQEAIREIGESRENAMRMA